MLYSLSKWRGCDFLRSASLDITDSHFRIWVNSAVCQELCERNAERLIRALLLLESQLYTKRESEITTNSKQESKECEMGKELWSIVRAEGIEPSTSDLKGPRSTTELRPQGWL